MEAFIECLYVMHACWVFLSLLSCVFGLWKSITCKFNRLRLDPQPFLQSWPGLSAEGGRSAHGWFFEGPIPASFQAITSAMSFCKPLGNSFKQMEIQHCRVCHHLIWVCTSRKFVFLKWEICHRWCLSGHTDLLLYLEVMVGFLPKGFSSKGICFPYKRNHVSKLIFCLMSSHNSKLIYSPILNKIIYF